MKLHAPKTVSIDTLGLHSSALHNLEIMWNDIFELVRNVRSSLCVLDYGSGNEGVSSSQLPFRLRGHDRLFLYDRERLTPKDDPGVYIARLNDIFGYTREQFDLINISYVLCLMEQDKAIATLEALRSQQEEAVLAVTDYTLLTCHPQVFLDTFNCTQEKKWQEILGIHEFYRTHARFSAETLADLVRESGYVVEEDEAQPLDAKGYRGTVVAYPSQEVASDFSQANTRETSRFSVPAVSGPFARQQYSQASPRYKSPSWASSHQ